MLKLNFGRILKGRAIEKPYTYLLNQGFSRNVSIRMNAGTMKEMKLEHMERLCLLFQCTPNDLFEWVPGAGQKDADAQPLKNLIHTESAVDLRTMLNALPYEQLAEVGKMIEEKAKVRTGIKK